MSVFTLSTRGAPELKQGWVTLGEYADMLKHHDWYFNYSDDGSVVRRGEAAEKRIVEIANLSPEHMAAFHKASPVWKIRP